MACILRAFDAARWVHAAVLRMPISLTSKALVWLRRSLVGLKGDHEVQELVHFVNLVCLGLEQEEGSSLSSRGGAVYFGACSWW